MKTSQQYLGTTCLPAVVVDPVDGSPEDLFLPADIEQVVAEKATELVLIDGGHEVVRLTHYVDEVLQDEIWNKAIVING